jgi:hypothetical protein
MYSGVGDTTSLVPGFPIRTSSDQRSVDSSPRHNAASHVLHRLPVPRHPPCALKHLQHKTVKNSRKNQKLHYLHTQQHPPPKEGEHSCALDARNHYPQIKHHTPPPKQGNNNQPRIVSGAPPPGGAATYLRFPLRDEEIAGLLSQSPIVCLMNFLRRRSITRNPYRRHVCCAPDPHPLQADAIVTIRLVHRTPTQCGRDQVSWCSLERR